MAQLLTNRNSPCLEIIVIALKDWKYGKMFYGTKTLKYCYPMFSCDVPRVPVLGHQVFLQHGAAHPRRGAGVRVLVGRAAAPARRTDGAHDVYTQGKSNYHHI